MTYGVILVCCNDDYSIPVITVEGDLNLGGIPFDWEIVPLIAEIANVFVFETDRSLRAYHSNFSDF